MKNLTIITSVIKTSTEPLIYSQRSVFNHDDRYQQSLKTIVSIRMNSPNTYIVFVESTEIPVEWENNIKNNVDFYFNISNTKYKKFVDSKSKGLGEASILLSYLKSEHFNNIREDFETISKFSGRYFYEDNFLDFNKLLNNHNDDKIIAQIRENNTQILTIWFCIHKSEINEFIKILEESYNDIDFSSGKNHIECFLYDKWIKNKKVISPEYVGVSGYGATHGGFGTL